jgi:LysM repeat protein
MKRLQVLLVLVVMLSLFGAVPANAQPQAAGTQNLAAPAASFTYIVQRGDTLARLAARFGTTIGAIWRANPSITNPNLIRIGQRLVIPTGSNKPPVFSTVKVALIDLEGGGGVGCGDSVVLVNRQVTPTTAPLTAAIRSLLSIKGQYYGQSGLYNALYQSSLSIQSVSIVNGVAYIRLTGKIASGGVCDDPRIIAQFERTAKQFSTVKSARVYINGKLLQDVLSLK